MSDTALQESFLKSADDVSGTVDMAMAKIAGLGASDSVQVNIVRKNPYRNKEMQEALFVTQFGAESATKMSRENDQLLREVNKNDHLELARKERRRLQTDLITAVSAEANLQQKELEQEAIEAVLAERLEASQKERDRLTKELKRVQGESANAQQTSRDAEIKLESNMKTISVMQIRIKNLQRRLEEATEEGRYVVTRNKEKLINVRELEEENFRLTSENANLTDKIEKDIEKEAKMLADHMVVEDTLKKEKSRAEVQAVALEHDLAKIKLECEPLQWRYDDVLEVYKATEAEMKTKQMIHEQSRQELVVRLGNAEASNNKLVEEIAAKSQVDSGMLKDMAEEQREKKVLVAQLEDKDRLCVEIEKRLFHAQQVLEDTKRELAKRDASNNELMTMVEQLKAECKVLGVKATIGNDMATKMKLWSKEDKMESDRLRIKLDALKDREVHTEIVEKEDEAIRDQLRADLEVKNQICIDLRGDIYHAMAVADDKAEKLKEVEEDLKLLREKFMKKSKQVDRLQRDLNERSREFTKRHEDFLVKKAELEDLKIKDAETEIAHLEAKKAQKDQEVRDIESVLSEKASEAEHMRHEYSTKIFDLDEQQALLQTELASVHNSNHILETDIANGEERIKNALERQSTNRENAAELVVLNQDELASLEAQVRREMENFMHLTEELEELKRKRNKLLASIESVDHSRRQIIAQFRQVKHDEDIAEKKLEYGKEELMQRTRQLRGLEAEKERSQARLTEKEEELEETQTSLKHKQDLLVNIRQDLKGEEQREMDYLSDQEIDKKKIHAKEVDLSAREEQHVQDGNTVKLKVNQLVGMLELKTKTVEKLQNGVERLKEQANTMEVKLDQCRLESNACSVSFKRKIDFERAKMAQYRKELEQMTNECNKLRQEELDADEKLRACDDKLHEQVLGNKTLLSYTYRTAQKAHATEAEEQAKGLNVRVKGEELDMLERDYISMQIKGQDQETHIKEMEIELHDFDAENAQMKAQVGQLSHRENVLLLRVEAQRNKIRDSHGNALADAHAEAALADMLEDESDKKMLKVDNLTRAMEHGSGVKY